MGVHVLLAIVGLVSVFALVLITAQRQRLARLEKRLSFLEAEAGVTEYDHQEEGKPAKGNLRERTHKLELRVGTIERRSLRPKPLVHRRGGNNGG